MNGSASFAGNGSELILGKCLRGSIDEYFDLLEIESRIEIGADVKSIPGCAATRRLGSVSEFAPG
jgi:hypothetical protein